MVCPTQNETNIFTILVKEKIKVEASYLKQEHLLDDLTLIVVSWLKHRSWLPHLYPSLHPPPSHPVQGGFDSCSGLSPVCSLQEIPYTPCWCQKNCPTGCKQGLVSVRAAVMEIMESGVDCQGDLAEQVPEDNAPPWPEERGSE